MSSKLLIALGLGVAAAVIDITPMVLTHANRSAIAAAFSNWVVAGLLIAYVQFGLPAWLNGLTVAVLTTIPVLFTVAPTHPKSIAPILVMSVVLGTLLGLAAGKWAK